MILKLTKKGIKALEYVFMIILLAYYACCIYNCVASPSVARALSLYPLVLSLYYYLSLVRAEVPAATGSTNSICSQCKSFRCRGASHCEFCDTCVPERDHHCPLVGKCICRQNSAQFLFFLFFLALQMFLNTFSSCIPEVFVLFSLAISSYVVWVCYIWSQNQTTIEFFKSSRKRCSAQNLYKLLFDESAYNVAIALLPCLRVHARVVYDPLQSEAAVLN